MQTTYNALISAYGKAGQLDKVMEVFQVRRGGEQGLGRLGGLARDSRALMGISWVAKKMQGAGCFPSQHAHAFPAPLPHQAPCPRLPPPTPSFRR